MDTRLIELLVCPICKSPLQRGEQGQSLVCLADRLAFPIRDGIPIMLESEAVSIDTHEASSEPLMPTAPAHSASPAPGADTQA
jgi:uncharacterized protein